MRARVEELAVGLWRGVTAVEEDLELGAAGEPRNQERRADMVSYGMTSYGAGTASAKDGGEDESDGESDEENEEGEEEKRMAGLRGMKRGGRRKGIKDSSAEGN